MKNTCRVPMNTSMTPVFALACATGLLCVPALTAAQEWTTTPQVTLTADYDDNARLRPEEDQQNKISGAELDLRARLRRRSPTGEALFMPRIDVSRYPNDKQEDTTDYHMLFSGEHNAQKSTWTFETRYSDQQVRSAEIADPDFGDPDIDNPISDDTGLIQFKNRRKRFTVAPGVVFEVSPRNSLEFRGEYGTSDYEENINGDLEDYSYGEVAANLIRDVTERTALSLGLFATRFDADLSDETSDAYGVRVQVDREFSERNTGYIYGGVQRIESDTTDEDDLPLTISANTAIAGLGMTREYEISSLVVDLQHSIDPTGRGSLSERTRFRAILSRQLSPLVTGAIGARLQTEKTVPDSELRPDRDFGQLQLSLNWRLNRNWSLIAAYIYTRQDLGGPIGADPSGASTDASSNSAKLGIRYAPPLRN